MLKYIGLFIAKGLLGSVAIAFYQLTRDPEYQDLSFLNLGVTMTLVILCGWITYGQIY